MTLLIPLLLRLTTLFERGKEEEPCAGVRAASGEPPEDAPETE